MSAVLAYCGMLQDGTTAPVPEGKAGFCGPGCKHCGPFPTLTLQGGVWVCAADYDPGD
jgi:phenylpropionate dioxygenase-like ring-hydroxylating dioxygenase large terminal subunit